MKRRCTWITDPPMQEYHDREWGVPVHADRKHHEFLILDAFQAGLSWAIVLKKREGFRRAFAAFDPAAVARFTPARVRRLLADPGIIRNRLKVQAAVTNARAFVEIQEEFDSFDRFIWQFTDGRTIQNRRRSLREIPARTRQSDAMSKALIERGFRFAGSTICYAYMQAAGMVNDHVVSCFRHPQIRRLGAAVLALILAPLPALVLATPVTAQVPVALGAAASAVGAATRMDPTPLGRDRTEARVEQVVFLPHASAWRGRLRLNAALNLEGLTMPDGVLTAGAWGEGFVDRRHPHTYVHELMLSLTAGPASVSAGKGFVPFGTDDPMNRPAVRFPANHHWSQILERALVIAGLRAGRLIVEGALFNGDEPEGPAQWPRLAGRFGDSWSLRVSAQLAPGVEIQGSRAHVLSPEHRPGAGSPHEKWSAALRLERAAGPAMVYALLEWARNTEAYGIFRFHTHLAEAEVSVGAHAVYARVERTERPEEERTLDPFRSDRPHLEDAILGISQWVIVTAGYSGSFAVGPGPLRLEPFVEGALAAVASVGGGILQIESVYGGSRIRSLTAGLRVRAGPLHRMGRYGVLAPAAAPHHQ